MYYMFLTIFYLTIYFIYSFTLILKINYDLKKNG